MEPTQKAATRTENRTGWAPSTFKSSRNNRATKVQRAEDFMDEEDLAAMNDDRRLENTETFKDDGFAGMRETAGEKRYVQLIQQGSG